MRRIFSRENLWALVFALVLVLLVTPYFQQRASVDLSGFLNGHQRHPGTGRHFPRDLPPLSFSCCAQLRNPLLLVASVIVVYWLQPGLPIRGLDFWLPTATVFIAALGWFLTARNEEKQPGAIRNTSLLLGATILGIALTRFLSSTGILTPSRPPKFTRS